LNAEVLRAEPSSISTSVVVEVNRERIMQGELVIMMVEATAEWAQAIEARNRRLTRWKEASN
jgi:hypothetical protein